MSTPLSASWAASHAPCSSAPTWPTIARAAPSRAAAHAWLAPLPPAKRANPCPVSVSPALGKSGHVHTRSALSDPTTTIGDATAVHERSAFRPCRHSYSAGTREASAGAVVVGDRRGDDDRSRDEPPGRFLHAHLRETGAQHGDDEHAEHRGHDRAAPAHEAGAADDDRRNRLELEAGAGVRIGGSESCALRNGRHGAREACEQERHEPNRDADRCPRAMPPAGWRRRR